MGIDGYKKSLAPAALHGADNLEGPDSGWRVTGKGFLIPSHPPARDLPDPNHWFLELALWGAGWLGAEMAAMPAEEAALN